ncbi:MULTISPECIES: hypothetical protein [Streptomyces]|uniref:hypothetical protein n=1 Tax=Streptomyces TaxID=1883 RepID=UPI0011D25A9B|nr:MULTISPECIES: hypothetical protein [Streptomyces]
MLLHADDLVVYDGRTEVTTSGKPAAAAPAWCWTTTWKPYCASPTRSPAPPRWRRPAPADGSPVHDKWWTAARAAHGEAVGTRALIEVLLPARHMEHEHVVAGLAAAYRAGALTADADAVALEAPQGRRGRGRRDAAVCLACYGFGRRARGDGDVPPTGRCLPFQSDDRPLPLVAQYDQLLQRRGRATEPATPLPRSW